MEALREIRTYYLGNPNTQSTPMGALCWAHHEIHHNLTRRLAREHLDDMFILLVMDMFGITREQVVHEAGRAATQAVIGLLDAVGDDDEIIQNFDDFDGFVEMLRLLDGFGGTGGEWVTALSSVAAPAVEAATRAGGGLPAEERAYADALFGLVKAQAASDSPVLTTADLLGLDGYEEFLTEARFSANCARAVIFSPDLVPDTTTTTSAATTSTTAAATTTTVAPGPGVPQNVTVSVLGVVTWDAPASGTAPTHYMVRVDCCGAVHYQGTETRSLDISGTLSGHSGEYTVRVQALTGDGMSDWTEPLSATIVTQQPGKPRNLAVSTAGLVTWDAPSSGGPVGDYEIWLGLGGGNVPAFTTVDTQLDISDQVDVASGEEFSVTVWARNMAGRDWTDIRINPAPTTTTTIAVAAPGAPTNVTISGSVLTWTASTSGGNADSYNIKAVFNLSSGPLTLRATVSALTYNMSGWTGVFGLDFTVQIRAENSAGTSAWTDAVSSNPTPPA